MTETQIPKSPSAASWGTQQEGAGAEAQPAASGQGWKPGTQRKWPSQTAYSLLWPVSSSRSDCFLRKQDWQFSRPFSLSTQTLWLSYTLQESTKGNPPPNLKSERRQGPKRRVKLEAPGKLLDLRENAWWRSEDKQFRAQQEARPPKRAPPALQQRGPLPMIPASHMGACSSPSCSISDPAPCCCVWERTGGCPAPIWEKLWTPGFSLAQARLSHHLEDWTNGWKICF